MSSSNSGASKKKQQDEQNLKTLRELAALLPNKQCFDCHQRGPTYVNMTIGSFVCTSCSGLLRGLNPPHRVKSISMAIFTTDEIEFLKSRGNEYCRRVWIGRYDRGGRSPLEDGVAKDETQMKDYLVLKYEKKRWYLSPSEAFANTPPPVQQIPSSDHSGANSTSASSQSAAPRSHSSGTVASPLSLQQHPSQSRPMPQQHHQEQDLFARNPVNATTAPAPADVLFDPFGINGSFGSSMSSPSGSVHQTSTFSSNGVQHIQPVGGILDGGAVPKSATVPAGFLTASGTSQLQPVSTHQQQATNQQKQSTGGDKYSALAELDDLFRSSSPVEGNSTADKRPAPPVTSGNLGSFPAMSTAPNNFYQARPVTNMHSGAAVNPFVNSNPPTAGQLFGNANTASSSTGVGFGFFPPAMGNSAIPQAQGYRQPQPYAQSQMPQMPQINPFAASFGNPRPATGSTSWNPFL